MGLLAGSRLAGWGQMDAHKCLRGKTALWRLSLLSGLLTKRKCLGPPLLPPASSGDEWLAHGAGLAGIWGGHVGCLGLCSPQQPGKLRWHMPCVLLLPGGKAPNARHPHALAHFDPHNACTFKCEFERIIMRYLNWFEDVFLRCFMEITAS